MQQGLPHRSHRLGMGTACVSLTQAVDGNKTPSPELAEKTERTVESVCKVDSMLCFPATRVRAPKILALVCTAVLSSVQKVSKQLFARCCRLKKTLVLPTCLTQVLDRNKTRT